MLSYSVLFSKKMENLRIFYRSRNRQKNACVGVIFFKKAAKSSCLQHCRLNRLQYKCFSANIVNFLRTGIMKNICKELFLKKLAASVLDLLINVDYILTGYEWQRKWFILSNKMFTFWYCCKIKNNARTHLR